MLSYVWRQDLAPVLRIDPVLHYYPLLSCYQEPHAPANVWKDETGAITGCLLPCDPPGRAWLLAATEDAVLALTREVPNDLAVTIPLWADSLVSSVAPERLLSTDALAVCTEASFCPCPPQNGLILRPLESPPDAPGDRRRESMARLSYLACFAGSEIAGYCGYLADDHGSASIETVVVADEWRSAEVGRTLMAAAADRLLEKVERVIFSAGGDNQSALGTARRVGFRTCYWLRCASPGE